MLTFAKPDTLASKINVNVPSGEGTEKVSFAVVFNNRSQKQIEANLKAALESERGKQDPEWANRQQVLDIVKSWELSYPLTDDGIAQMEDDAPGMIENIFIHYHMARRVTLAKN